MAVAIIRQLTLAQVQAAIDAGSTSWNNNYAGTQVYVTDKDWHLACYLDRIAKPLSGVLKITNGYTPPNWLTPETLLIDTGTIADNIDGTEGNPVLTITVPNNYIYVKMYLKVTTTDVLSNFQLKDSETNTLAEYADDMDTGEYVHEGAAGVNRPYEHFDGNCTLLATNNGGETGTMQAIIEFRKLYL